MRYGGKFHDRKQSVARRLSLVRALMRVKPQSRPPARPGPTSLTATMEHRGRGNSNRCSIVVVTAAGRTADPGCGAGVRGAWGGREKRGRGQAAGGKAGAGTGRGRESGAGTGRGRESGAGTGRGRESGGGDRPRAGKRGRGQAAGGKAGPDLLNQATSSTACHRAKDDACHGWFLRDGTTRPGRPGGGMGAPGIRAGETGQREVRNRGTK